MPELPEVETIRRGLLGKVLNKTIQRVVIRCPQIILHPGAATLEKHLLGKAIQEIARRGKYLLFDVDAHVLVIHLGMTGQLTYWDQNCEDDDRFVVHPQTGLQKARQHRVDKHTHASLYFSDGNALHYRDVRRFGRWRLYCREKAATAPELARLGLEPFTSAYKWKKFQQQFDGRGLRIKSLLLDQRFVAGVGNIYADESLFEAGIHPESRAGRLTLDAKRRLFRAIPKVLRRGLKYGGTSFQDFVNAEGQRGKNQEQLKVYGREGEPCFHCKTLIVRVIVSQRSSHFCPTCQPPEGPNSKRGRRKAKG